MLSAIAQLVVAVLLTLAILGGGMFGFVALMHASNEYHAELAAERKADRQAAAFIRIMDICEANPKAC